MQLDKDGLIVTLQKDGGDSCAETARYLFLTWFNFIFMNNEKAVNALPVLPKELMSKLEVSPGVYVRNPNDSSNPKTTSRDQLLPVLYFCAAYKDYARLGRLFLRVASRGFFAQNYNNYDGTFKMPDQMLTCIGDFIRCGGPYTAVLYPILVLFDIITFIGNLGFLITLYLDSNNVDDNNTDIQTLGAVAFKPTPASFLNRQIFKRLRPKNAGQHAYPMYKPTVAAIFWYHSPLNYGNVEVSEMYHDPVEMYL